MIDERSTRRQFFSAPPTVSRAVAAVMEPALAVVALWAILQATHQPMGNIAQATMLLTFFLLFPGYNRFATRPGVGTFINISLNWAKVIGILAVLMWVTGARAKVQLDVYILWAILTPCIQSVAAVIGHEVLAHHARQPKNRRNVVIVGAGLVGQRVAKTLRANKDLSRDLLGFFEDRDASRISLGQGETLCGRMSDLPAFIEKHGVQEVFVTLPLTSQPRIVHLMQMLQNTTASLYFVPDVFGVSVIQGRLEDMAGLPVVGLHLTPFDGVNGVIKRFSDIVLSSLILLLIAPILAAVALGVKLSSPGPVLFRQRRTGLDGEVIEVYKFRSMRVMDDGAVVKQATRGDPRITPFGAFIRKTSLDELPQFINVLQGRMSIVGPRPHALAHNEQYRSIVSAYMARHKVRPGITGWAQVNGLRGETDTVDKMAQRVEYDLEYLRNWSLGLDLLIIARTVGLVAFDKSAY